MPWHIGVAQNPPKRRFYTSIRGRGGGAKWYIARYYEVLKGKYKYGVFELSPLNIQYMASVGYCHRCVVKCSFTTPLGALIIRPTNERRRIRTGIWIENGEKTFEAKIYFTKKRGRSKGFAVTQYAYRPIYANILIRLPQLHEIYRLLANMGIINKVYVAIYFTQKNELVIEKI